MTEQIVKKYFCDYCGSEIDQEDRNAIQVHFPSNNAFTIIFGLINQPNITRHIMFIITDGHYCNTEHYVFHIIKRLENECKFKGV